jgi:hypothetical protein
VNVPPGDTITAAPGPAMKLARSTTFSPEKMLSVVILNLSFVVTLPGSPQRP